jgi:hypothetical protein
MQRDTFKNELELRYAEVKNMVAKQNRSTFCFEVTEERSLDLNRRRIMSTQIDRDQAKTKIDEFGAKFLPGAFINIKRADVVKGFKERVDDPTKINQGNAGLCPSAAVVFSLAKDKPTEYVQLVVDLYESGKAKFGEWELKPCADLRTYTIAATDTVPAVDWIPLASIRDSENWLIDFQQTSDKGGAWGGEIAKWLKKAGYKEVIENWNYFFTKDEANLTLANTYHSKDYNVLFLIHADILSDKTGMSFTPNHWVVLNSSVNYLIGTDKEKTVEMTVFTWGTKRRIPSLGTTLKLKDFIDSYYGFVACKF